MFFKENWELKKTTGQWKTFTQYIIPEDKNILPLPLHIRKVFSQSLKPCWGIDHTTWKAKKRGKINFVRVRTELLFLQQCNSFKKLIFYVHFNLYPQQLSSFILKLEDEPFYYFIKVWNKFFKKLQVANLILTSVILE